MIRPPAPVRTLSLPALSSYLATLREGIDLRLCAIAEAKARKRKPPRIRPPKPLCGCGAVTRRVCKRCGILACQRCASAHLTLALGWHGADETHPEVWSLFDCGLTLCVKPEKPVREKRERKPRGKKEISLAPDSG